MDLFDKKFVYCVWDEELRGKECFYDDDIAALIQSVNENKTDFRGCLVPSTSEEYAFKPVLRGQPCGSWRFAYYDPNYACKIAFNKGSQIQHRALGTHAWYDDGTPCWDTRYEYRIKPAVYYVGIGQMKTLTYSLDATTYKHVYSSFNNPLAANDWIAEHKKFVPVMRAFEKGLKIEYKYRGGDWTIASTPSWDSKLRYRVKPKVKEPHYYCSTCEFLDKQFSSESCRTCFGANKWEPKKQRMTNRELAKWLAEGKGQILEGLNKFVRTIYAYKDGDDTPCRKGVRIRAWNEAQWHEPEEVEF